MIQLRILSTVLSTCVLFVAFVHRSHADTVTAVLIEDGEVRDIDDNGVFDFLSVDGDRMRLIDNIIGSYRPLMLFDLSAVSSQAIEEVTLNLYVQGRVSGSHPNDILASSGDNVLTLSDYDPNNSVTVGNYNSQIGVGPKSLILDLAEIRSLRDNSPFIAIYFDETTTAQSTFYSSEYQPSFPRFHPSMYLVVTAAPEPSGFLLLGIAASAMVARRPKRSDRRQQVS